MIWDQCMFLVNCPPTLPPNLILTLTFLGIMLGLARGRCAVSQKHTLIHDLCLWAGGRRLFLKCTLREVPPTEANCVMDRPPTIIFLEGGGGMENFPLQSFFFMHLRKPFQYFFFRTTPSCKHFFPIFFNHVLAQKRTNWKREIYRAEKSVTGLHPHRLLRSWHLYIRRSIIISLPTLCLLGYVLYGGFIIWK